MSQASESPAWLAVCYCSYVHEAFFSQAIQAASATVLGSPKSVSLATELLGQLIYKDTFDGRFKNETADFLDYASIKSKIAEVEETLRKDAGRILVLRQLRLPTDGGSDGSATVSACKNLRRLPSALGF